MSRVETIGDCTRLLTLLLLGLIMPEPRLLWRLNMSIELPEPFILLPVPESEWNA